MSWYFFGGFSAYLMLPSGEWRNHSGWAVTDGWSGAAWMAMSIASSMPCASTALRKPMQPVDAAELRGDGVVAALGRADGVRRPGIVAAVASRVLLRPLRFVRPIGWIGGR